MGKFSLTAALSLTSIESCCEFSPFSSAASDLVCGLPPTSSSSFSPSSSSSSDVEGGFISSVKFIWDEKEIQFYFKSIKARL